jgi:uncharacterized protein (DUF885 family)
MRRPLLAALFVAVSAGAAAPVAGAADAGAQAKALHQLFDANWERGLREDPTNASYLGDHRYDDRWPDLSPASLDRIAHEDRETIAAVDAIPPAALSADDQLNRDMFRRLYVENVATYDWGARYLPVNHRNGVQTADQLTELLPFATVKDYENWITRLDRLGPLVDQTADLMRAGVSKRLVQPRVIMERVSAQVAKQVVDDPTASPFYAPFRKMPDSIAATDQERLRATARKSISTNVIPAYRRFQQYVDHEYLPASRDTVGIWDTPGGDAWYQNRIRWYTTTDLTADQIHEKGLSEVARIRGEMQKIVDSVGFKGSLAEFMQYLRTDPKFRYTDPQRLLQAYEVMAKTIDPLLPQFFGHLPRMPYGVRPIPDVAAPDQTTAYYQPPSIDGKRAGYYYVNLYKPEERPTYEIPVLSIHEAVPGHHLQIALAQELGDLPMFRRNAEVTAFVEGWGLYSESLGQEMGLYSDPYDKFGQLTYEMWRAVRLVVDTGMHHKKWTRQQAIDYFKANAAKTELDIVNEIDRYIAWPGQALAYKVGELKIKELRARATQALGDRFDIRAFHDVVLGSGAVTLDVLERNVTRWQNEVAASRSVAAGAAKQ